MCNLSFVFAQLGLGAHVDHRDLVLLSSFGWRFTNCLLSPSHPISSYEEEPCPMVLLTTTVSPSQFLVHLAG